MKSPTEQRDEAISLVKRESTEALQGARAVSEAWSRAQALSWVARFTNGDVVAIAAEAALAAAEGHDTYSQCAVRAWDIAALAERGHRAQARASLDAVLCVFRRT